MFTKKIIEIIEEVAIYSVSWFLEQQLEILGMSLPKLVTKCLVMCHVSFFVDLGNLTHGEPDLVLQDERVQNCFIWSSKWFLSGAAYHLFLEMDPQCDVGKIMAVIQSHVPDATLEKYTSTELSFILPKDSAYRYRVTEF